MAIYDKFADSPERIKIEGQEVTIQFIRNGDGTATIKWNIPNIAGCAVDELAYDGIVITVSERPANYVTTSPKDGTYYNADPTFDSDLHTGDKIDSANVVGAFYHDKTTTELTVTDVADKTPYYVSGYAVDNVGNYHREGVHAYSIPTGQAETDKSEPETPGFHDLQIDTPEGISVKTRTGLATAQQYELKMEINGRCFEFNDLLGSDMQTYEDMADTINKRLKLLVDPLLGPEFPNTGGYVVDVANEKVFEWDGSQNVEQPAIFLDTDPAMPVLGTYWYKPSTDELRIRESSGWTLVTAIIAYPTNPSQPSDGTIWLDKVLQSNGDLDETNTMAWMWEHNTWCKQPLIISTRNPLLPPVLTSGDYWYNSTTGEVFRRDPDTRSWVEVDPIVWDTDPNTIADANYWYSSNTELAYIRNAGVWDEVSPIRYEERNAEGDLDNPVALHYWFIPSEQRLFQRNAANDAWVEINVIISFNDPAVRSSCDTWWDDGTDLFYVWDEVNSEWDQVNSFTQSATDPALPPQLEDGTLWYNPETEVMQKITGLNCSNVTYICYGFDPTNPPVGTIWHDTTNQLWYIWDGTEFVAISVIVDEQDPYGVSDGIFWYDTANNVLYLRVAGAWVQQTFSTESLAPEVGTFFFNTVTCVLYKWNGTAWVEDCGLAKVVLKFNREVCLNDAPNTGDLFSPFNDFEKYGRDIIQFQTCETGCDQRIEVDHSSTVFTQLQHPIIRYSPATGRSVNEAGPMYKELGVGTDGSPDERRKLQQQIRVSLGSLGIQVELTKEQLDECIDNALLKIRKYSSYAYEHVLFFLDVFPNQQKYSLTNKCVGFNKITNINVIHRTRGGFLGAGIGGFGGNDIFAYSALQNLYTTGTFDMLSYHLVSSYIEDLQYLFADQLVYTFYEDTRVLSFHQVFYRNERVLLDAFIEVPEQKLITNRYLSLWIKKWAIAEAKMILSQVRGKFQSLPGPNGSTVLNAQELITQAENEMAQLNEELYDRSMQDHNSDVMSQFYHG